MAEIEPQEIFESPPSRRPLWWALIGAACVGIAAFAWMGIRVAQPTLDRVGVALEGTRETWDPSVATPSETPPVSSGEEAAPSGGSALGNTYALDTFLVNINDRQTDRYLKLKAVLELDNSKVEGEIASRLPQIRDLMIGLLGSKSFDEVRTIEGKNFLREEMILRVNALLTTGSVKRVFFTEFVVQ